MNSDTRMFAARRSPIRGLSSARPADHVEPAFGGALGAALRHQAGGVRPGPQRDRDHLRGRRHLQVERLGDLGLEAGNVVVADVAAVFAQMRGDAVGARRDRQLGGAHRIGMPAAARVADGGDVVDVDAESQMRNRRRCPVSLIRFAGS